MNNLIWKHEAYTKNWFLSDHKTTFTCWVVEKQNKKYEKLKLEPALLDIFFCFVSHRFIFGSSALVLSVDYSKKYSHLAFGIYEVTL